MDRAPPALGVGSTGLGCVFLRQTNMCTAPIIIIIQHSPQIINVHIHLYFEQEWARQPIWMNGNKKHVIKKAEWEFWIFVLEDDVGGIRC